MSKTVNLPLRWVYRSAVTGKFVSKAFYEANPNTTIRQMVRTK